MNNMTQGQEQKRIPHEQMLLLKAAVFDQMANPIVMFDEQDILCMHNLAAEELLNVKDGMQLDEFVGETNLKLILTPERRMQGKTKEFSLAAYMNERIFLIYGKENWQGETYQGIFLTYNDITDQERMKDEATFYATHDKLTGLWNRDYFFEIVDKTLQDNPNETFLMMASDIGQFKLFNDILGTKTGDKILIAMADGFREKSKENWVCARFSSDRFALLMPKKDYDEDRFLAYVHQIIEQPQYTLRVHNYIGVYEIVESRLGAEQMYDRAFMALESIKGDAQEEIAYYNSEIRERRRAERLTVAELELALKEDQFVIYIQPQIDSLSSKSVGGEALVRWKSPKRGLVLPGEFVPIFERNGMITRLDYHVWELACRLLAKWKEEGKEERSLSINISPKDFYLTDLYEKITGLVEKYGIEPERLKLEITETAFVLDMKKQMSLVKRLQNYGFLIEMDDFGSGYSSLNSLKDINVDIMKLDMKFFEKTRDEARSQKIIKSVVTLAHGLNMPIIAEGVEEEEQIAMLQKIGSPIIQGFYYSKPLAVDDYERYMEKRECEDIRNFIRPKAQEDEK